jgi:hypothetical protein
LPIQFEPGTDEGVDLADFDAELLRTLAEEQAHQESGRWDGDSTLWSRVAFRMASARGKLLPSPVLHKSNLDRELATAFIRAVKRLVAKGLVRFRPIGSSAPQFHGGYNLHQLKDKDIVLTDEGRRAAAEAQAALQPPALPVTIAYVDSVPPPAAAPARSDTYVLTFTAPPPAPPDGEAT